MRRDITEIKGSIEPIKDDITTLTQVVEAWQAVTTGGKFLMWLGGILAGFAAVLAFWKMGLSVMLGGKQ